MDLYTANDSDDEEDVSEKHLSAQTASPSADLIRIFLETTETETWPSAHQLQSLGLPLYYSELESLTELSSRLCQDILTLIEKQERKAARLQAQREHPKSSCSLNRNNSDSLIKSSLACSSYIGRGSISVRDVLGNDLRSSHLSQLCETLTSLMATRVDADCLLPATFDPWDIVLRIDFRMYELTFLTLWPE